MEGEDRISESIYDGDWVGIVRFGFMGWELGVGGFIMCPSESFFLVTLWQEWAVSSWIGCPHWIGSSRSLRDGPNCRPMPKCPDFCGRKVEKARADRLVWKKSPRLVDGDLWMSVNLLNARFVSTCLLLTSSLVASPPQMIPTITGSAGQLRRKGHLRYRKLL